MRPLDEYRNLPRPGTPGPWMEREEAPHDVLTVWTEGDRGRLIIAEHAGPDAAFIAAAPDIRAAVDELAAEVERLTAIVDVGTDRLVELQMAAGWLLRLKDGPRDEQYEREKPEAWATLREAAR